MINTFDYFLKKEFLFIKRYFEKSEKPQILRTCFQHITINISRLLDYQHHSMPQPLILKKLNSSIKTYKTL